MPRWQRMTGHAVLILIQAVAFCSVQEKVPEPYLDEIFHVPQAQCYCAGDWRYWDPSITTPPGLYILAVVPLRLLRVKCSPYALRSANLLLSTVALPTIISSIQATTTRSWKHHLLHPSLQARVISFFPLIFFFSFLFYTDVGSLTFVIASYALAQRDQHGGAALVGAASLWFRQTNVVWVAFILATSLLSLYRAERNSQPDPQLSQVHSFTDALRALETLLGAAWQHPAASAKLAAPYLPVFAAFLAFLKWNGGIVLGHKEMHVAVVHVPQMFYFVAFATCMLAPALFSEGVVPRVRVQETLRSAFGNWRRSLAFGFILVSLNAGVYQYTIEHPFLLADNRHYTFYVWRRVFRRYAIARYAITPAYALCGYAWIQALQRRATLFWTLGFVACTALVLVPTPLIEPRYFLIPLIMLRLKLTPSKRYLALEAALYLVVNATTLYMFLYRPFEWPGWKGSMRFMW